MPGTVLEINHGSQVIKSLLSFKRVNGGLAIGILLGLLLVMFSQQMEPQVHGDQDTGRPIRPPSGDETPIGPKWWPSKWGAGDQRGAANLISRW